jgi:hypothetical protein
MPRKRCEREICREHARLQREGCSLPATPPQDYPSCQCYTATHSNSSFLSGPQLLMDLADTEARNDCAGKASSSLTDRSEPRITVLARTSSNLAVSQSLWSDTMCTCLPHCRTRLPTCCTERCARILPGQLRTDSGYQDHLNSGTQIIGESLQEFATSIEQVTACAFPSQDYHIHRGSGTAFVGGITDQGIKQQLLLGGCQDITMLSGKP